MATSTPANANSPATISPVGPPPAITTACSVIATLLPPPAPHLSRPPLRPRRPTRPHRVPAPAPRVPPTIRRPRGTHTSTTTHACRDSLVRRFWPLPAIIWHDPGLAASPPVCDILKVERICTPIRGGATPAPAPPNRRSSVSLTRSDVEPARLDRGRGARRDWLTHLQATAPTSAPSTTPHQTPTRARPFVVTARARLWRAMTRRQGRGAAPRRTLGRG